MIRLTNGEIMAFFDSAYRGTPLRDIGHPRKMFVGLVRRGEISGAVLDIGCGTGGACPLLCTGRA